MGYRVVNDEARFYRTFMADVRSCSAGRVPACVVEIERRIQLALTSSAQYRDARWGRVVAAVAQLLDALDDASPAAARLRAFVRENGDLTRRLHRQRRVRAARRVARM